MFFSLFCRIKHENIVALEDIYESPDHLYLIMQLWVEVLYSFFNAVQPTELSVLI